MASEGGVRVHVSADASAFRRDFVRVRETFVYPENRPYAPFRETDEARWRADMLARNHQPWLPSERTQMPVQLHMSRYSDSRPAAHTMIPPSNGHRLKPSGGLWTSTLGTSHADGWLWYCVTEHDAFAQNGERTTMQQRGWMLDPWPAHILRIETVADVQRLWYAYATADPHRPTRLLLDWEQMRRDGWEGLHIPDYWAEHIRFGLTGMPYLPSFYGWDCESTIWFRWCFWTARPVDVSELVARIDADC
jgi:hypothetical protein